MYSIGSVVIQCSLYLVFVIIKLSTTKQIVQDLLQPHYRIAVNSQCLPSVMLSCKAQIPLRWLCSLWQSLEQVRDKVADLSRTQVMKVATQITSPTFMICVRHFVANLSWTLSPTFTVHCNGLNSIRATQTGLSRTCHRLCRKHLNIWRWFVSVTFVICVHDFPRGEVLLKVDIMEFGLNATSRTETLYSRRFMVHQ